MATRLLKKIDLLEGLSKSKFPNLELPDMELVVTMEIDKELEELIDKGKEGLRWAQLQDAADAYVAKAKKTIAEELKTLNDKVATLPPEEGRKMVATTGAVLKQVAAAQEAGVNKAVEAEWDEACRRSKTLSKFKRKCVTKAMVGALAISTSLASMIATGGSVFIGVVAIMKASAELAILVADIAQDVDGAADELMVNQIELRQKFKDGQQPSRGEEALSDASAIIGKIMSTVKTTDLAQVKYEAKIASLEKSADDLVGALNAGLDKIGKIKTQEAAKLERITELSEKNKKVLVEVTDLNKALDEHRKYNAAARKEIADWKAKREPKTAAAIKAGTLAKLAVGLGAAARTFGKIAGLPIP